MDIRFPIGCVCDLCTADREAKREAKKVKPGTIKIKKPPLYKYDDRDKIRDREANLIIYDDVPGFRVEQIMSYIQGSLKERGVNLRNISMHYDIASLTYKCTVHFDTGDRDGLRLVFKLYKEAVERETSYQVLEDLTGRIYDAYNTELEKLANIFMLQGE